MLHLGRHDLRMQGSARLVDIVAVWACICDDDLTTKVSKELRSDRGSSSIGAVDNNSPTVERQARDSCKQEPNILSAISLVNLRRNGLLWQRRQTGKLTKYLLFNG